MKQTEKIQNRKLSVFILKDGIMVWRVSLCEHMCNAHAHAHHICIHWISIVEWTDSTQRIAHHYLASFINFFDCVIVVQFLVPIQFWMFFLSFLFKSNGWASFLAQTMIIAWKSLEYCVNVCAFMRVGMYSDNIKSVDCHNKCEWSVQTNSRHFFSFHFGHRIIISICYSLYNSTFFFFLMFVHLCFLLSEYK